MHANIRDKIIFEIKNNEMPNTNRLKPMKKTLFFFIFSLLWNKGFNHVEMKMMFFKGIK